MRMLVIREIPECAHGPGGNDAPKTSARAWKPRGWQRAFSLANDRAAVLGVWRLSLSSLGSSSNPLAL